jgi:hypothetical protein
MAERYCSSVPSTPPVTTRPWVASLLVALAALASGSWTVVGQWWAYAAFGLIPPALGLPQGWPPLQLAPLGGTTWTWWAIETVGAFVMIVAVWLWTRAGRRPFLTPLWAVIVGVTLGNLVRIIGTSVIALHDLRTFGVAVLGTVLLSLLWGLVLGLVAATVHRLMAPVARG